MDATQNFQLNIIQAATFSRTIAFVNSDGYPIDLTDFTAQMIFRTTLEDEDIIIELSTNDNSIIIGELAGTITFTISASDTAELANGQQMVYNLFITSPDDVVSAILGGTAIVVGSTIR